MTVVSPAPSAAENEGTLTALPDMELAQMAFRMGVLLRAPDEGEAGEAQRLQTSVLARIREQGMVPYYHQLAGEHGWSVDDQLVAEMEAANAERWAAVERGLDAAQVNMGESEMREALRRKADYYTQIGHKDLALAAVDETLAKTVGIGNRMDLVFNKIRLGLFHSDTELSRAQIERAHQMLKEGGDWDRRNRLKVYEGFFALSVRDFERAARLFLDTVSTFTCAELMTYERFVIYTVYVAMIALERGALKTQVIHGSEILEVLHGCPEVSEYLFSLYECQYARFFRALATVERVMKADRYLHAHYAYYVREMKVKAFAQLLESYRSLTLTYMSEAFNVTEDYMDRELSRFIADGRLHCRIDKVRGIVMTNRPDTKNARYQGTIKQGDILLNRVQKLSRVINI
ncbi:hypothetical protein TCAL_02961 [Tigriopus californicus]|uniref:26S proteasome non-ATPase regulatory subunit 6 n=1 Tax=Tigriopus californicus TaxID=6832 RepID=A0A553PTH5_TIGCA|nr:26S proteasome non-ATPase regulatory subunit 6-like [Tigriopus californicus]TRY80977.1 hypothetical protein TCAL_02961 [Tigriopus californicus]|eukprot:TCALIF_02961-PA protein Name:"Similar to Psmd6 26S proteasome non-ATPase regulatory subunit 6 (Mus musculus)" AED:0.01 eAED:0.01 QI:0/-1/0/1/-1/1/1/0/402